MNFRRSLDWWLAVVGAALLLLYIPNAPLHIYAGKLIYARDLLLIGHLGLSLVCVIQTGHFRVLAKGFLPLVLLTAFFAPLFLSGGTLKEGLGVVKWVFMWSDALLTGYFIFLQRRFVKTIAAILVVALGIIATDCLIGQYELWKNAFFFPANREEETSAGVAVSRAQQLEGLVRVQGLQRDVFTFANFMSVGFTICLCVFITQRPWWLRAGAVFGCLAALDISFKCGGRAALFGIALASLLGGLALLSRRTFQDRARQILTAAMLLGTALCLSGLGRILSFVFSFIGSESRTFNLQSTFERDGIWADRLGQMVEYLPSFVTGVPFAAWVDGDRPTVLFADNQVVWLLHHAGVIGLGAVLFFFYQRAQPITLHRHPQAHVALILFLAVFVGEGMVHESMLYFSVLPLFILVGFFIGADAFALEEEEEQEEEDEADDELVGDEEEESLSS